MDSQGQVTTLHNFVQTDGASPNALIQATDGNFYGTTAGGGSGLHRGTVFRSDAQGTVTTLHEFQDTDGGNPGAGVVQASDGALYGTTSETVGQVFGTVFRITTAGSFTTLHGFQGTDGASPGGLIQGSDGALYGTAAGGLAGDACLSGCGVVYRIDAQGKFAVLHAFTGNDGAFPNQLLLTPSGAFYGTVSGGGPTGSGAVFQMDSSGNVVPLVFFTDPEGVRPFASLLVASDGFFYGTTTGAAGPANDGGVFRLGDGWRVATVHPFGASQFGPGPSALVESSNGLLYGTTYFTPGAGTLGTVFSVTKTGTFETLHTFGASDGAHSGLALLKAADGQLYGATTGGLAPSCGTPLQAACGAVFRLDSQDQFTKIYAFTGAVDGSYPHAPLIQAASGTLYGTTAGGLNGSCVAGPPCGTVYSMDAQGVVTTIHTFGGADGSYPAAPLLLATDGFFYGTTVLGGGNGFGTVFRMDSSGTVTTLHSFGFAPEDGSATQAGLVQPSDGNLYGTTPNGGTLGFGTLYRIDSQGTYTTLHGFSGLDAGHPSSGLVQASDGFLYGTAPDGGPASGGVVYRLTSSPFSLNAISPTSGSVFAPDVLVLGGGFAPGMTMTFGGQAALNVEILDATSAVVTVPFLTPGKLYDVEVQGASAPAIVLPGAYFADFLDIPELDIFHRFVETIFRAGITAGCGVGNYCRNAPVRRDQMAVFLLKSKHGAAYAPPPCAGIFPDTPCPGQFTDWIEELAAEQITGGCGGGDYCPGNPVTRGQMSAFLLKTEHGSAYAPPPCAGVFGDVACPSLFADWVERLYSESVTGGCSSSPLLYCPAASVTRGQMAAFLVRTFQLP